MPSRAIRLVCGLAALLAALPVVAGKVYQWKDAQGVTHFADEPPPGQQAAQSRSFKDAAPAEPTTTATAAARPQDPACATARTNLERLQGDGPVGLDANGDGQPDSEMDPQERARQVELARKLLGEHCGAKPGA